MSKFLSSTLGKLGEWSQGFLQMTQLKESRDFKIYTGFENDEKHIFFDRQIVIYIYRYNYLSIYLSISLFCLFENFKSPIYVAIWDTTHNFGLCMKWQYSNYTSIMQAQESKFDSPVPLVFGQKSDLMSKYEYINYIHTLIYSTICMIKSFLKFNVHMCINTPRMKNIWKNISCRSQFHYFFRGKNHGKNPIFHDKNHGFLQIFQTKPIQRCAQSPYLQI